MRGDVVTNKMMCGINGCQQVTITHVAGGDLQADFTPKDNNGIHTKMSIVNNKPVSVRLEGISYGTRTTYTPKDNDGLKAAFSLMCQTSQGEWEYLLVDEGTIMLIDGQEVLVKRK